MSTRRLTTLTVWTTSGEFHVACTKSVAVTGLPDNEWGHIVAAFVVSTRPNLSLDEIREHCRAQLPGYALPKQLELVEAIPRTSLGKVRRRELTV